MGSAARAYLRRAASSEPVPDGWQRHPAGTLAGIELEVVYRPDRHEVCRAVGLQEPVGLDRAGYQRAAALDDGCEVWVRDRSAGVRARLAGFRVIDGGCGRSR